MTKKMNRAARATLELSISVLSMLCHRCVGYRNSIIYIANYLSIKSLIFFLELVWNVFKAKLESFFKHFFLGHLKFTLWPCPVALNDFLWMIWFVLLRLVYSVIFLGWKIMNGHVYHRTTLNYGEGWIRKKHPNWKKNWWSALRNILSNHPIGVVWWKENINEIDSIPPQRRLYLTMMQLLMS